MLFSNSHSMADVSISNSRRKEKEKESEKAGESDDDNADEEEDEEDPEQVLETQQKPKWAPGAQFDASPDSGKHQPKKKAKTASKC